MMNATHCTTTDIVMVDKKVKLMHEIMKNVKGYMRDNFLLPNHVKFKENFYLHKLSKNWQDRQDCDVDKTNKK